MNIWDKLLKTNIENKERYQKLFLDFTKKIKNNDFKLVIGETKYEDYYLIVEENRMNSYFVHIVPKSLYELFKEMQKEAPNSFLGFSIKAGEYRNKDVRISCFGVDCSRLGKALIEK